MPQSPLIVGYGLSQALPNIFPSPIAAKRIPTVNDIKYQLGQIWIVPATNVAYILTSVVGGIATWVLLETGGGAGAFTTLTSTGATTLATTGASTNTFGNTTGATSLSLLVGTGNFVLNGVGASTYSIGAATTTGTITIGGTAQTGTIGIGGSSAANMINIGIGTGANTVNIATTGTGTVTIGNATGGVGLAGIVSSNGILLAQSLYATGDAGGVPATVGLSNTVTSIAGGTGAYTITSATGSTARVNTGFLKLYNGTAAIYIPFYAQTN